MTAEKIILKKKKKTAHGERKNFIVVIRFLIIIT